jgi:inosine-uridine nucleoside N-ribohydrolase
LLVDTDPGLDDALALAVLTASPDVRWLAAVAVGGNVPVARTYRNLCGLLRLFGRADVPALRGLDIPGGPDASHVHGRDGLAGYSGQLAKRRAASPAREDWLAYVLRVLERAPRHGVDIITLGPLTNLAALIRAKPELLADKVCHVIAMAGAIVEPGNIGPMVEFNVGCDPEAAGEVLRSGLPLLLVPLDVTHRVTLGREVAARLARTGTAAGRALAHFLNASVDYQDSAFPAGPQGFGGPVSVGFAFVHDAVAVCAALRPGLFTWERLPLAIETQGVARGMVLSDRRPGRPKVPGDWSIVSAAMHLDRQAVRQWILEKLCEAAGSKGTSEDT